MAYLFVETAVQWSTSLENIMYVLHNTPKLSQYNVMWGRFGGEASNDRIGFGP